MIKEHNYKDLTWIDVENPDRQDVEFLIEKYDVHPLVGEELLQPTLRPRVDVYKNIIYLILHFPTKIHDYEAEDDQVLEAEIDFIVGKDFLITTHYNSIDALNDFEKKLETSVLLKNADLGEHAGLLFFHMVKNLYRYLQEDLDVTGTMLKTVENKIFSDHSRERVKTLAKIRRHFLDFKQTIRFHGDILKSFSEEGKNFFGVDFSHYLASITSEYWKVFNALEGHRETLAELRETHHLLLTSKTNRIMKTISILAFIAVPITLMVQIISVGILDDYIPNEHYMPIFLVVSLLVSVGLLVYFKYKKWI